MVAQAATPGEAGRGWACPLPSARLHELLKSAGVWADRRLILRDPAGQVRACAPLPALPAQTDIPSTERWQDDVAAHAPVVVHGAVVAVVEALGPAIAGDGADAVARLTAARLADAWVAAQEADSLAGEILRAYEELHLLYELGEALTGQLTVPEVADLLLEKAMQTVPAAWAEVRFADASLPVRVRRGADWEARSARDETHDGQEQRLSASLRGDGHTVGRITLVRPSGAAPFSSADGKLLAAAGAFVGGAMRTAELRQQALSDPLTGLLNHRGLLAQLDAALAAAAPFAFLLVDVDNFKLFNDTHGHLTGDAVLTQVAATVRAACRAEDGAGRYGGDEFGVLVQGATAAEATAVARRLSAAVRACPHTTPDGSIIPLSLSIGLACYPADGGTRQEMLAVADNAMYAAKRHTGSTRLLQAEGAAISSLADLRPHAAADLLGDSAFGVVTGLVSAVDAKDHYTRRHSDDVARLALLLAEALGLTAEQCRVLAIAGALHDVGKIAVPDRILRKPGRLTDEEYTALKRHVVYGVAFIRGVLDDDAVIEAVAHHHERWDGRGYPYGVAGPETPLLGRIMQIADTVSAMMLDRPYRQGLPWARVASELRAGAGTQFDPALVEPFIAAMGRVLR